MFGLTPEKILIILAIAAFIIGPQRLPGYAATLARWVRSLKGLITSSQERIQREMGVDAEEIDWKKLDPRQYDPRRIIREALLEDEKPTAPARPAVPARAPGSPVQRVAVTPLSPPPPSRTPAVDAAATEAAEPAAVPASAE